MSRNLNKLAIVSIGGNTLVRRGERGTLEEQLEHAKSAMASVARILEKGYSLILTHGNGPIVGNIVIRNELAKNLIPPMPLYMCDADSEGGIGFMIQQSLYNHLRKVRDVVTVVTQVVVNTNDPEFSRPSKPIGPFYTRKEAEFLRKERGWVIAEDSQGGYRRVVPSPRPIKVVEGRVIKMLSDAGVIVVAAGGGGVPVVELPDGNLRGIDAVIDKDLATSCLAKEVGAELFINLTQTDRVYLKFGKTGQTGIDAMSLTDAKRYLRQGEFPAGSMGPKIEAAILFLEAGGKEVVITTPELVDQALEGRSGTKITR